MSTTNAPVSTRTFKPTTDIDCTFEQSICKWDLSASENSFNWTRLQAKEGPIDSDHTLGTQEGWYLYADSADRKPVDIAVIKTGI